jgi:membrane protein DedA with SNARE-associated domain
MTAAAVSFVSDHGSVALFITAVLENTALVNTYFPGAIAILSAMALTSGNPSLAMSVWLVISAGAFLGQIASFYLGRRMSAFSENNTSNFAILAYAVSYVHPYLGSLSSLNLGKNTTKSSVYLMILIPSLTLWNIFWGLSMYYFGNFLGNSASIFTLIIAISLIWIAAISVKTFMKRNRQI